MLNHVAVADYLVMEATAEDDKTYPSNQIFKDLLWYLARMLKERSKCPIPKEYEKFIRYVYANNFPIISFNYDLICVFYCEQRLTVPQMSKILNIHTSSIYNFIRQNNIKRPKLFCGCGNPVVYVKRLLCPNCYAKEYVANRTVEK